jgi:hypothetical protein
MRDYPELEARPEPAMKIEHNVAELQNQHVVFDHFMGRTRRETPSIRSLTQTVRLTCTTSARCGRTEDYRAPTNGAALVGRAQFQMGRADFPPRLKTLGQLGARWGCAGVHRGAGIFTAMRTASMLFTC